MPSAIVTTNLLDSAAGITVSTEDSTYVKAALNDGILSSPFRFAGTSGGTVEIDHGAAKVFDTVGICNHNFAPGSTTTVKGGVSSPPSSVLATPSYRAGTIWADLGASPATSFQYASIRVEDGNTVSTGIGELVLGVRTELPRAHRYGKTVGVEREQIVHKTLRKSVFAYDLAGQAARVYQWRVTESELAIFETVESAVKGQLRPFLWVEDTAGTAAWFARLKESNWQPREMPDGLYYDVEWAILEESHGVTLLS